MKPINVSRIALAFAVVITATLWLLHLYTRPYEINDQATIRWISGGEPWTVDVHVRDTFGSPVPGIEIHPVNVSGGRSKLTRADGSAHFTSGDFGGEDTLIALCVEGEEIMNRRFALGLLAPSVEGGLQVHVILHEQVDFLEGRDE